MTLPAAVKSHHTVWVSAPGARPRAVRYAVDGERLVCFGDDGLASVPDGSRVSLAVHEIAGGEMLATFSATMRELAPDAIDTNALVELLELCDGDLSRLAARHRLEQLEEVVDLAQREAEALRALDEAQAHDFGGAVATRAA